MTHPLRRPLLLGLAALALAAGRLPAAEDPAARKLLDDVAKAYKGLDSYQDQGQFRVAFSLNGQEQKQSPPMKVAFARPNKLDLDLGAVRLTSDGKTLITTIVPLKKYIEEKAPETIDLNSIRKGPGGPILFGAPQNSLTVGLLLELLTSDDAVKSILEGTDGLKLEADRKADGQTIKPLLVDQSQGPDIRLLIDAKTNLLTGIDLVMNPEELAAGLPKDAKFEVKQFGWAAGKTSTGDVKADTFAYQPPKGFDKVDSLQAALGRPQGGGDEPQEPAMALVGKPAPDFKMMAIDGDALKPLKKDDLAGKVVMIDFWATWCGPCLRELPEVQKMVQAFAKDKKDVRVIALSVDENPGSDAEMRKLVEKTLQEKKISLGGNSVGSVALDTTGDIARTYQANAIPMIVLLDGKGVVQKVHIGYTERDTLEEEINALLDGKSLAQPKAKKAEQND